MGNHNGNRSPSSHEDHISHLNKHSFPVADSDLLVEEDLIVDENADEITNDERAEMNRKYDLRGNLIYFVA